MNVADNQVRAFRFGRRAISLEEAWARSLAQVRRQPTERVDLFDAFGRRLAGSVTAAEPMPHFRRAGVDGYAVAAADTADARPDRPALLRAVEAIAAGSAPRLSLRPGEAARIMTGGMLPEGADAVVMLEMTDRMEGQAALPGDVTIRKAARVGDNMTPIGGELPAGATLLPDGQRIGAGETALLAACGYAQVPVYRRPRVAVFATGAELLPVEAALAPGRLRNSNGYMLACQLREAGAVPLLEREPLPDDAGAVERRLREALEEADVLITTGGVSVGDRDVLAELFARWDGELLFNKIAMRPASPTSFGVWRDKPLFALSGNPGACYVGFELLVRPFLRAMTGCPDPLPRRGTAFLTADFRKGSAYPRYIRGISSIQEGRMEVRPAGQEKSSIMASIKDADCLLCIPAGGAGLGAGEMAGLLFLDRE